MKTIQQLITLSRPEWAFIFSQVGLMVALLYRLPIEGLIIGPISIFLFTMGHFSLNGYYDQYSDNVNPRAFSLRNPLIDPTVLSIKSIGIWVTFLWVLLVVINYFTYPASLFTLKFPLMIIIYSIGIIGSLSYSVPPLRLKSRPFLDITATFIIIGLFIPVYIGLLSEEILVPNDLIGLGILLTLLLVLGIHLPTMLVDIETDSQVGDMTTAVYLGRKKAVILTSVFVTARVIGLIIINIYMMRIGLLIESWIPFILGLIEIIAIINLLKRKDQEAASLLYKTIIITSGGGAVIFGLLYSPILVTTYNL